MREGIIQASNSMTPSQQSFMLKKAYGLSLSKMSRTAAEKKELEMTKLTTKPLYLPKFDDSSSIITDIQIETLWEWLPSRFKLHDPTLLYSTLKDGFSLNTLIQKSKEHYEECAFFLIKTDKDDILGGFTSDMFRLSSEYYGTSDCFIFTFFPVEKKYPVVEDIKGGHVFTSVDYLCMGAGGKGPAIQVDCDINCGLSFESESFANPRLNQSDESNDFQVSEFEVYYLKA